MSDLYGRLDTVGGLAFMQGNRAVSMAVERLKDQWVKQVPGHREATEAELPALEQAVGREAPGHCDVCG